MSGFSSIVDAPNRLYSRAASIGHRLTGAGGVSPAARLEQHMVLNKVEEGHPLTKLDNQTLHEMYVDLATAAKEGRLTKKDWDRLNIILVDSRLKKHFFDQPFVQRKLVKALMMGNHLDERLIDGLRTCTPNMTAEEQDELFDRKFLWMMDGVQSRVVSLTALRFFTSLSSDRQKKLVDSFGSMPNKTAADYKGLAWDEHGAAVWATVFNGRIRFELANNLSLFSDSSAQITAVKMLNVKALGARIDLKKAATVIIGGRADQVSSQDLSEFPILDAAIKNVACLTDLVAQETIVQSIMQTIADRKLGLSRFVELAENITTFAPQVQQSVSNEILSQAMLTAQGSDASEVRTQTMANVNQALSAFTNPDAKKKFVQHVAGQLAGAKEWLAEASVQSFFAQAIQDEMLSDRAVIGSMVTNLPDVIDDAGVHSLFQSALHDHPSLFSDDQKAAMHEKLCTIQAGPNTWHSVSDMMGGVSAAAIAGIKYFIYG